MPKTKFSAVLATFVVCYAFWILLTWSFAAQELIVGAVVSLLVALFAARFFIHANAGWLCRPGKFFSGLLFWICIFPIELIKANFSMAKICFGNCKAVNPGIVKVPTAMKSDYGLAAVANSITLTPGTITMETAEDAEGQNWLYVHWINVEETEPEKAGEAIKGTLEKGLRRVWE